MIQDDLYVKLPLIQIKNINIYEKFLITIRKQTFPDPC